MKPVADTAHSRGYKFLLWFEPERVTAGSWLDVNHPDWIFKNGGGWWLLNLGHPDALAWVKTKFSGMIGDIGIDCYRQDFNVFPLAKWRYGEASDRLGMNEIKHIMGLYEYLDYLLEQHPNLVIDNCASGGRRIDIEMMKRSIPLWRSDLCWVATPEQSMEYGLSYWLGLHGVGSTSLNKYDFRSGMGSTFSSAFNHNDPSIWTTAIQLMKQYNEVRWIYKGDFYPLTPYSLSESNWMAWQFHRDDVNQGLVQAFRRSSSTTTGMTFKLQGLTPTATYSLKNYDSTTTTTALGSTLMNTGLYIPISSQPGSALIKYWKN
jgi:alpha-galactosidase